MLRYYLINEQCTSFCNALTSKDIMPLMMRATINQLDKTHFLNDSSDSSDSKSRRNVARGPAGSTSRHFWKTSQYLQIIINDKRFAASLSECPRKTANVTEVSAGEGADQSETEYE